MQDTQTFHNKRSSVGQKKWRRNTKDRCIDYQSLNVLRYEHFQTLKVCSQDKQYHIETDKKFINDVENIAKIRKNVVFQFLQKDKEHMTDEQCNEIDYLARLHCNANIVNSNSDVDFQKIDKKKQCNCGCRRGSGDSIGFFVDQQKLNILGPGILLMFLYKRSIIAVLAMMLVIYGIFALVTNLVGNGAVLDDQCASDPYCEYKRKSSDQNKNYNNLDLVLAQIWLGLIFCIVWVITLRFIKFIGKEKNKLVDRSLRSASDYTVKIQNLPYGSYSQIQLIQYFSGLYEKIQNKKAQVDEYQQQNPFKMKSIQIIYNMQFSREMVEQIFYLSYVVDSYLVKPKGQKQRNYIKDAKAYNQYKNKLKQTYQLLVDLRKKFLNDSTFRQSISTTCCLIQFKSQYMRQLLLNNYGIQKVSILKQVQSKIKNFFRGGARDIIFKGNIIQLERAPEPSDLLWTNCEKTYSLKRKLIIYTVTFAIIIFSFGIQMALEYLQNLIKSDTKFIQDQANKDEILTAINIAMSVGLLVVNRFLWFSLYYLLQLEYNHTLTQKIVSQMNKVLFATSINTIVVPIITRQIFIIISPGDLQVATQSLYASDGLSGMAFDYQISVLAGLSIKFFDPLYFIKKLVIEIKCLRNLFIRFTCGKIPDVNPEKGVSQINKFYQGSYLDVAENYMYIISAILHAAFFCHLQPFVIVLVFAMISIFYLINRFKILRFCMMPQLTQLLVFETALTHAGLVPIVYGIGSIVTSYFQQQVDPSRPVSHTLIPSSIAIFIGLLAFFNPGDFMNLIVKKIMQKCQCISLEKLIGEDENQQYNAENIEDEMGAQNKHKTKRVQVYYQNSNSLRLLGFEKMIKGEEQKEIMNELKAFCESFFPKQNKNDARIGFNVIGKQINQKNKDGILGFLKVPAHVKDKIKDNQVQQEDEDSVDLEEMGQDSRHVIMPTNKNQRNRKQKQQIFQMTQNNLKK